MRSRKAAWRCFSVTPGRTSTAAAYNADSAMAAAVRRQTISSGSLTRRSSRIMVLGGHELGNGKGFAHQTFEERRQAVEADPAGLRRPVRRGESLHEIHRIPGHGEEVVREDLFGDSFVAGRERQELDLVAVARRIRQVGTNGRDEAVHKRRAPEA